MRTTQQLRDDAHAIFAAGLQAVDARKAVLRHLRLRGETLIAGETELELAKAGRVFVVGAGKAGGAMAAAVEFVLGERIQDGVVVVKYDHLAEVDHIRLVEAGHPVPDDAGQTGAQSVADLLSAAEAGDLVICLLSGGGSALLPLPVTAISLAEKQQVTTQLLRCGATIAEINAVRKHISRSKGGQLARLAHPATLVTLILSDVVGDPLDAIASGPTVPDPTTFADVSAILDKYNLTAAVPASVRKYITKGMRGDAPETPKTGDAIFETPHNVLVGSNLQALTAAAAKAEALGYTTQILSSSIEGETREIAKMHAAIAREVRTSGHPIAPPACLISGGETTVTLRGQGKGGRNQEFVLAAAQEIAGLQAVVVLSAGTDGTDGPTDAAGAIADGDTAGRAREAGLDPRHHLDHNDAYPFFEGLDDLVTTGPTNTNVMDLRLLLVG